MGQIKPQNPAAIFAIAFTLWGALDILGRLDALAAAGFTVTPGSQVDHLIHAVTSLHPIVPFSFAAAFGVMWFGYAVYESQRFPRFDASILEIQEPDPAFAGPDLHVAFVVKIMNSGAPSIVQAFSVVAYAVNGTKLDASVFHGPAGLRLPFNAGTSHVQYLPEHFLMERANVPVVRGAPVTGIVPVVLGGIRTMDDVDLSRLSLRFADGTGDKSGKAKWWSTEKIVDPTKTVHVAPKTRPGLPSILPGP